MKRFIAYYSFVFSILLLFSQCNSQADSPVLKGPYLGQKPPSMTPVVFASGILSNDNIGAFCSVFSPDRKYFLFNRRNVVTGKSNIYWISAKIIEELKQSEFK